MASPYSPPYRQPALTQNPSTTHLPFTSLQSLRIVPASTASSSSSHVITYAPTAHPTHGVHDSLRHGLTSSTSSTSVQPGSTHALQARLAQWSETQEKLKLGMQRGTFGLGLPLRVMMEKKIVMEVRSRWFFRYLAFICLVPCVPSLLPCLVSFMNG